MMPPEQRWSSSVPSGAERPAATGGTSGKQAPERPAATVRSRTSRRSPVVVTVALGTGFARDTVSVRVNGIEAARRVGVTSRRDGTAGTLAADLPTEDDTAEIEVEVVGRRMRADCRVDGDTGGVLIARIGPAGLLLDAPAA